jgi:hypothetical protein
MQNIDDAVSELQSDVSVLETTMGNKLDKLSFEYNKTINFGSTGCLYIGKFGVYDTQVTVEITATTSTTYSGKLVIATQNYVIKKATVYGDAANTIAPNIFIKPSTTSDRYIEVYFKPSSWSKNVIHVFGSAVTSPTNVCTSVSSVPTTATSKPENALSENFSSKATVESLSNRVAALEEMLAYFVGVDDTGVYVQEGE